MYTYKISSPRPNMMAVFSRLKQNQQKTIIPFDELKKNKPDTASLRDRLRQKVTLRRPETRNRPNPSAMFQANLAKERKKDQIRASGKIPGSVMSTAGANNNRNNGNSNKPMMSARDRLKSVLSRPQQVSTMRGK